MNFKFYILENAPYVLNRNGKFKTDKIYVIYLNEIDLLDSNIRNWKFHGEIGSGLLYIFVSLDISTALLHTHI